jgi:hypothetical protein
MTSTASEAFPDHFPNGCPPSDSKPAGGTHFRLVRAIPPTVDDFATHHERGVRGGDSCEGRGLSIYALQADAANTYRHFARKHGTKGTNIGHLVAKLELKPDHGRLKPTPRSSHCDSHHTWWPYEKCERLTCFKEVAEDASDGLDP